MLANSVVLIGPAVVDRLTQGIDDPPDHCRAHRNRHDAFGSLNHVPFPDQGVFAEQHRAHIVFFQVERDAFDPVRKIEQFTGHDVIQPVDSGDAVSYGYDGSDLAYHYTRLIIPDLFFRILLISSALICMLHSSLKNSRLQIRNSRLKPNLEFRISNFEFLRLRETPFHLGELRSDGSIKNRAAHLNDNSPHQACIGRQLHVDTLSGNSSQPVRERFQFVIRKRHRRGYLGRHNSLALVYRLQIVVPDLLKVADPVVLEKGSEKIGGNRMHRVPAINAPTSFSLESRGTAGL